MVIVPAPWRKALSIKFPSACSIRSRSMCATTSPRTSIVRLASAARRAKRVDAVHQFPGVHLLQAEWQSVFVGARVQEQVGCKLRKAVGLARDRAQCALELRTVARALQRQLDLRLQVRERGAQLVTRVGDEAPLTLE